MQACFPAYHKIRGPIVQALLPDFGEVAISTNQELCMHCWLAVGQMQLHPIFQLFVMRHLHMQHPPFNFVQLVAELLQFSVDTA